MISDTGIFGLQTPITKREALLLHPMTLAYIGDAVQSLYTRTRFAVGSDAKPGELHHEVTNVVKAVSQAKAAQKLQPLFDEEEQDIFRRARNCKIFTQPKNAGPAQYRRASGFEAVLGFLYLTGRTERLNDFLSMSFEDSLDNIR